MTLLRVDGGGGGAFKATAGEPFKSDQDVQHLVVANVFSRTRT